LTIFNDGCNGGRARIGVSTGERRPAVAERVRNATENSSDLPANVLRLELTGRELAAFNRGV
jgi:hypothetical protein